MAGLSGTLTAVVVSMLESNATGVNARVGAIEAGDPVPGGGLQAPGIRTIAALNANVDTSEKAGYSRYPALLVYCDKLSNTHKEKFREFSGRAHVVVEVRQAQDRLDGLEQSVQLYVDAVCALLDDSRGDLGSGLFYAGGYEVSYEPAGRGGSNFLQRAKVGFEVEVSKQAMAYMLSNAERWYVAKESTYGQIPAIAPGNRIPAVKLTAQQQREKSQRKDKTGSRTWQGSPVGMRMQTTFDLTSYMRDWPDPTVLPSQGPLFEAAMGAPGVIWGGNTSMATSTTTTVAFASPHGLTPGQAITSGGEIRFVSTIVDTLTVIVNAPFAVAPGLNGAIGQTANYSLALQLPSVSILDYWDPATAVQRALCGAAVDRMTVKLNGDFHEFEFKGIAQDLIDSGSFEAGQGGAAAYPAEPAQTGFSYAPVPGNLGQVWLGVSPSQFFSVSAASIQVQNDLDTRAKEFGTMLPQEIVPGMRTVSMSLELFEQDDQATAALYQAARQQSPISVMFQLGQVPGQMLGIYLQSLVPTVPQFDDSDKRLQWKFSDMRAQGTAENEIVVAFG
jgi:hypothetical protein